MISDMPRIRGRTGQAQEGEHKGKWFYEISLWDFTGENLSGEPFHFGPFDSQDAAKEFGSAKVKECVEHLELKMIGESSGKYMDMKNGGIMRPWVQQ